MNSRAPFLNLTVASADGDLFELTAVVAGGRFHGEVMVHAGADELLHLADRMGSFVEGRAERRDFELGEDNFAGFGTLRLVMYRQPSAESLRIEVALRVNPAERVASPESCVVHLFGAPADVARFETELRRLAARQAWRAALAPDTTPASLRS